MQKLCQKTLKISKISSHPRHFFSFNNNNKDNRGSFDNSNSYFKLKPSANLNPNPTPKPLKLNKFSSKPKDKENNEGMNSSSTLIFQPKGGSRTKDDDVHAQRMLETMKYESGEDFYYKMKKEIYKYTFDFIPDLQTLNLDDLNVINIENEETFYRVPKLTHSLDCVVQKPGIYTLDEVGKLQQDKGKYLKTIPPNEDVNLDKIPPYIPPSQDKLLLKFAKESKIKYVMSTSTISSVLSQIYFLFSSFKNPQFENVFEDFENEPKKYMISQRKPVTNFLRKLDEEQGVYAFDSDPGLFYYRNAILLDLGKVLERFLTLTPEVFTQVLLGKDKNVDDRHLIPDDHHRFMKLNNDICLRSQIDCYSVDKTTGKPFVFEIKTRTCCPMRYDFYNYTDFFDYKISDIRGLHSSFEREYYDLIRGAFLKYAFQLKIGRMDGAFIAYHNTKEIFGFEYVKSSEIMNRVFGSEIYADVCFLVCSRILTEMLDKILEDLKGQKYEMLKIGFYSCNFLKKMVIFVELMNDKVEWGKENLIEQTQDIKDEMDYYTKYQKFKNKLYKYEFFIYPFINGVQQKMNNFTFQKHHQIEVKYKFQNCGTPSFVDYMNFLHDAYKMDTLNLDLSYAGIWMNRY